MTWRLLASKEARLAAAVPFYGPFPEGGSLAGSKAAVSGSTPSSTRGSTPAARLRGPRSARPRLRHQIVTYPGVDHAFFNPTSSRHDPAAAAAAYRRMLAGSARTLRDVGRLPLCLVVLAAVAGAATGGTTRDSRSPSANIPSRRKPASRRRARWRRRRLVHRPEHGQARPAGPEEREGRGTSRSPGPAPHGVIVGPDGAPWITDGGQNAIVRVDPRPTSRGFPLPTSTPSANLNTAAFDRRGVLWFTGQSGTTGAWTRR